MSEPLSTYWNVDALSIEQNDEKSIRLSINGVPWIDFYGRTAPPVLRVVGAPSIDALQAKLAAAERDWNQRERSLWDERDAARAALAVAERERDEARAHYLPDSGCRDADAKLSRAQALARAYRDQLRVNGPLRQAHCAGCNELISWDDCEPVMCYPCIEREHAKAVEELG